MARIIRCSEGEGGLFSIYERAVLEAIIAEGELNPGGMPDRVRAEAERKVREACAEGLRRGLATAEAQYEAAVAQSAQALRSAAEAMKKAHEEYLAALEPHVLKLVQAIASRLVRREVQVDPDLVLRTVRAALANLTARERVEVRLNPRDLEAVRAQKLALLQEFDGVQNIDVVPDESVEPGGCIAESEQLVADARLDVQLNTILDALMGQGGDSFQP